MWIIVSCIKIKIQYLSRLKKGNFLEGAVWKANAQCMLINSLPSPPPEKKNLNPRIRLLWDTLWWTIQWILFSWLTLAFRFVSILSRTFIRNLNTYIYKRNMYVFRRKREWKCFQIECVYKTRFILSFCLLGFLTSTYVIWWSPLYSGPYLFYSCKWSTFQVVIIIFDQTCVKIVKIAITL